MAGKQGKSRTGEKVACKHGCGFETDHKGALNLHENKHCKLIFKEKKEEKKQEKNCCENPNHELVPTNHFIYKEHGYTHYCTNCEEVFK